MSLLSQTNVLKEPSLTETSLPSGDVWKEAETTTLINRLTSLDSGPEGTAAGSHASNKPH